MNPRVQQGRLELELQHPAGTETETGHAPKPLLLFPRSKDSLLHTPPPFMQMHFPPWPLKGEKYALIVERRYFEPIADKRSLCKDSDGDGKNAST